MNLTQQETWVGIGVGLTALVQVYKLFVKNPKSEKKADQVAEDVATVTAHLANLARELANLKSALRRPAGKPDTE
jgi:DNA anti-recombination protein RmuC